MSTPDLTSAAHDYASRGWRVIPLHRVGPDGLTCSCNKGRTCTSKGKHPKDNKWQEAERLSAADIQATWDTPAAPNLGIATGAESGFWVLDIDPKNGGMENFGQLIFEHGGEAMPETTVAQTGSGGYHYFFALPDFEVRNSADRVCKGVDVRGNGGQIVAAPSRTDKGVYTIIKDAPIAQAPDWLLELVRKEEVDPSAIVTAEDLPKPEDLDEQTWKRLTAYANRAIVAELSRLTQLAVKGWEGEPWNHTTFEVSCALVEFANSPWCAYSLGQAQRDIMTHAPRDADFDDYVVRKTFQSAIDKVGPKARPMPEDRRSEPDPMFSGPDVRQSPTEGGGAPANPVVGTDGPWRYFGGEKGTTPLYDEMAKGVMEREPGPIGWGRDEDFWEYEAGVWHPNHYAVQHRLIDILGSTYKAAHVKSTADVVQRHAQRITGDPLEQLMNFGNTMLDWRTGETCDHDPLYGSTVQFGCDWEPDAECPKFDEWLAGTLHPDYVALVWEMIGYLMYSGNPKHHAFMLYGIAGSGKSTLLRVITDLLGESNIASEALDDLTGNRFRTAQLFGKIANIAGDIDASYQENTATFKRITGEDAITGEHKNLPPFRFTNWAVPVFSANKIPGSADVTEGYLRRWIILRFTKMVAPEDRIDGFSDILARELPGIAVRAVSALRELMSRGHFDPQGEALKGKEEFAVHIDQVRRWFADGEATIGPEITTPLVKIYANYSIWADRSGQKKVGEVEFSHRLEAIGYPVSKVGGETYHLGITVPDVNHHVVNPSNYFGH